MTENTDTNTEIDETTTDNSAYLTAACLIGFGAIAGAGVVKGYSHVKDAVTPRVTALRNRRSLKKNAVQINENEIEA